MKKIFIFILVLLVLVGCGKKDIKNESTLKKIMKKGYFVVGLDNTFAPMGFVSDEDEIVGFDIDLAKEVAKRMKIEVQFKPCDWDGIIFELKSKKIDMVWSGMTITEQRKKEITFSKPYFTGEQTIITRSGSDIKKISDLSGKTIGIQMGSSSNIALEKNPISKEVKNIRKYGSNVEVLLDLEAGRTDAIIIDSIVGKYYVAKKEKKENKDIFTVVNDPLAIEDMGIGMRKEDLTLIAEIDKIIVEMKEDGAYNKIYEKWFGRRN